MGVKLLGKIKIHEIAKKLELNSKEVLEVAKKLKIEVTSHLSGVDETQAKQIEEALTKKGKNKTEEVSNKEKQNKEVKKESKKEEKAPVIIRREVIIADEKTESEKEKEAKRQEQKNKQKERKQKR